jgi:adenosylcobinamide amidohydrolase
MLTATEETYDMTLTLTIKLEDGLCDNMGDTLSLSQTDDQGTINTVVITRKDLSRMASLYLAGSAMVSGVIAKLPSGMEEAA